MVLLFSSFPVSPLSLRALPQAPSPPSFATSAEGHALPLTSSANRVLAPCRSMVSNPWCTSRRSPSASCVLLLSCPAATTAPSSSLRAARTTSRSGGRDSYEPESSSLAAQLAMPVAVSWRVGSPSSQLDLTLPWPQYAMKSPSAHTHRVPPG